MLFHIPVTLADSRSSFSEMDCEVIPAGERPNSFASFEGAIFCDEHPPNDVTTQNVQHLQRGFVKDVRRGTGEDADKILADVIVTDPITIAAIEDGKREISCGYKCDYKQAENGAICQCNIRGNHVALVDSGRAGKDVAIKDHALQTTRKENIKMSKKPVNSKPQRDNRGHTADMGRSVS
jgi:hypothetical protein